MKNTFLFAITIGICLSACKNEKEEDNVGPVTPQGVCATDAVSYSATIQPILANNCLSCHDSGMASGNVDLSTHDKVAAVARRGALYGSVAHQGGYVPMPYNGKKLSDCDIAKIKAWIDAGTPNN